LPPICPASDPLEEIYSGDVNKLRHLRGAGESFSDVILRLAADAA
jgi:predicted CopG family antitoxin